MNKRRLLVAALLTIVPAVTAVALSPAKARTPKHGTCDNTTCHGAHLCDMFTSSFCSLNATSCMTEDCNVE